MLPVPITIGLGAVTWGVGWCCLADTRKYAPLEDEAAA